MEDWLDAWSGAWSSWSKCVTHGQMDGWMGGWVIDWVGVCTDLGAGCLLSVVLLLHAENIHFVASIIYTYLLLPLPLLWWFLLR